MSTDNNHDRWKEGNTIDGEDAYNSMPAGVFVECNFYEREEYGAWIASIGYAFKSEKGAHLVHDDLSDERRIIPRPADAPAYIPVYAPQAQPATSVADKNAGRKDDAGKNRLDLLPPHALAEIGKVLTFGAARYGDDNWRKVPDARKRYTAALLRHVVAWMCGERNDPDSGLHHLAHAGACVLFLLDVEVKS